MDVPVTLSGSFVHSAANMKPIIGDQANILVVIPEKEIKCIPHSSILFI